MNTSGSALPPSGANCSASLTIVRTLGAGRTLNITAKSADTKGKGKQEERDNLRRHLSGFRDNGRSELADAPDLGLMREQGEDRSMPSSWMRQSIQAATPASMCGVGMGAGAVGAGDGADDATAAQGLQSLYFLGRWSRPRFNPIFTQIKIACVR